jgi:hypothetical protein
MTLHGEIRVDVSAVRAKLLELMADARTIDDKIREAQKDVIEATHLQTSLKSSIMITLDSLDRIDERLRKKPPQG